MTDASLWLLGTVSIGTAVALFLTVAVSLYVVLTLSREKFRLAQEGQSVLMQAVGLQEDLDKASSAVRRYLLDRNPDNIAQLAALSVSAPARAQALANELRPYSRAAASTIENLRTPIATQIAALRAIADPSDDSIALTKQRVRLSVLTDEVDRSLENFRRGESIALAKRLDEADRDILFAIGLAMFGAAAGPGLGLLGIFLLQRARGHLRLGQMQNELMHVQRLTVMGETAAALAHDVSHPLTAANNYLGALRRTAVSCQCKEHEKIVELAGRTAGQITRASAILLRLRRFIEKREAERRIEQPADMLRDSVALLGQLDSDVQLTIESDPSLPPVLVDRVQIQQVLINLMRNAVEATEGCTRRQLSLTVSGGARHTVLFSIADTGRGLPQDVARHLFRPFVSSKREGMGVGLSICRNIVLDHAGTIWAEANPEGGTIFRFDLPAAPDAAA